MNDVAYPRIDLLAAELPYWRIVANQRSLIQIPAQITTSNRELTIDVTAHAMTKLVQRNGSNATVSGMLDLSATSWKRVKLLPYL